MSAPGDPTPGWVGERQEERGTPRGLVRLLYLAHVRLPSDLAHGHQILQMCEAFAGEGAEVRLLCAAIDDRDPGHVDLWDHYGVARNFKIECLPTLGWPGSPWWLCEPVRSLWLRIAWVASLISFTAAAVLRIRREGEALVYSRDAFPLWAVSRVWPGRASRLFFEVHAAPGGRIGTWLRRRLANRIGGMVMVTEALRRRHLDRRMAAGNSLVAHDGARLERFDVEGDRRTWRVRLGWPLDALIAGYAGRLRTQGQDKGIVTLARAVAALAVEPGAGPVRLGLVGGSRRDGAELLESLEEIGIPPELVLHVPSVSPAELPGYLRAFDVCALPLPWTEHFAFEASPLKLFEYMASGSPIVASDLPALAEVLRDGHNSLLVPPADSHALAGALRRLRDEPGLGERLAGQAAEDVKGYAWSVRARRILEAASGSGGGRPHLGVPPPSGEGIGSSAIGPLGI